MASKEELASVKRDLQIVELQRKAKLAAWNEYISFGISKGSGLAATLCGGLDMVDSSLIPHVPHPEMFLGAGIALLGGKSVVGILAKLLKSAGVG
jgi:hypothetical protein